MVKVLLSFLIAFLDKVNSFLKGKVLLLHAGIMCSN